MVKLITENIDIWSAAQTVKTNGRGKGAGNQSLHGIKKLRELILELAVRGKLVPQDPNDEPASVLLEKIAKEKKRLIKEGKIKKQEPLTEISEDEKPFELPDGWEWMRIGNYIEVKRGASPRPKGDPRYFSTERTIYHWIKIGDLRRHGRDNLLYDTDEFLTEEGAKQSVLVPKGTLIITNSATIGVPIIMGVNGYIHDGFLSFPDFPSDHILRAYFLLGLKALTSHLVNEARGLAQLNMNSGIMRNAPMAVAPLSEQHRIVAKVDELMVLCDRLEQQQTDGNDAHQTLVNTLLTTLTTATDHGEFAKSWQRITDHFETLFATEHSIDQLKQTILQLAVMGKLVPQDPTDEPASVLLEKIAKEKKRLIKEGKIKKQEPLPEITEDGEPFELPQKWAWVPLGNMVSVMDAGWSPACMATPSPNINLWGVLKTTSVQIMNYLENENKQLPSKLKPRPQYEVKRGDILITRAGPKNRVAISCLVDKTRPNLMISDKIIRFHLVEVGIHERFISLCLNAGATAEYLEKAKSGMAESQMNISQEKLKAAPIPLCSIAEQHRIVAKVDELMALCEALKDRINDAQNIQIQLADAIVEQAMG